MLSTSISRQGQEGTSSREETAAYMLRAVSSLVYEPVVVMFRLEMKAKVLMAP